MEMECVCGQKLESAVPGEVAKQYAEHQAREDHKISPEQWLEAGRRIAVAKEKAGKAEK